MSRGEGRQLLCEVLNIREQKSILMASEFPQPKFAGDYCNIPGWKGKVFRLYKSTWDLKRSKPEREHLAFNFDLILAACADPDIVRKSTRSDTSLLIYKMADRIRLRENVEVPFRGHLVLVVKKEKVIQTIYFTKQIKAGEQVYARDHV